MATATTTPLPVAAREPSGSRAVRRLRRLGLVPGVVYGGESEPQPFQIDARELRRVLTESGAVLDLQLDGAAGTPVVVKEVVRHPVTAEIVHLDLLRVRLDVEIQATVALELTGSEDSPGVKRGGVLEHLTREVTIESLPNDIPDAVSHDISAMEIGETLTLETVAAQSRYKIVGEPEVVIATITPPRLQTESVDEIEAEVEVVGEAEAAAGDEEPSGEGDSGE